ncbi:aminotransferase class I/II-fold pyridoxal phosphate-dependent enzyme [Ekhidna sp.]
MAKIIHNNILDTVDSVFSISKEKRSLHLHAEDETLDGRHLTINGKKALHFGTCGYLGLEQHPKLKQGAIDAIEKYGVQFPMSRTYISNPLYKKLEEKIHEMYNAPVVISKNCTLAHLATIPIVVRENDLIILDHLVHTSVQEAAKKMLSQGVKIEMIRHNNLEMLENIIEKNRSKYDRIWYMADGVYSMYGDYAPIKEMIALAEKYDQLHLYVDDAHGTSWTGKFGTGYVMSQMDHKLYRKMILTSNLGKAFGACGGLTLFPNEEFQRKVNVFGGPLTFSVQIEPPTLGAALASAELHLSGEVHEMQDELRTRINYFNSLLKQTNLPLVEENDSPIFFIGVGTMDMGNYLVREMTNDGVYVNIGPYPAVPVKNIGIRITISRHNTLEDIETLVDKLEYHFERALEFNGQTLEKIHKAFKMNPSIIKKQEKSVVINNQHLKIQLSESILEVDKKEWDEHLGKRGMFDWNGLNLLERSYKGNELEANNWKFRYLIIKDAQDEVVLMTFYTSTLYKEDIFSRASISIALEEERKVNPNYMVSRGIFIGSLFTEGNHLYLNQESSHWKDALNKLIDGLYEFQEEENAINIMFRDLEAGNKEMDDFMTESGFVKMDLPESCIADLTTWNNEEEFIQSLTKSSKKGFKHYVKKHEHQCYVEFKDKLSEDELAHALKLHKAVNDKNIAINSYLTPDKVFEEMVEDPNWEFGLVYINRDNAETNRPIVYCFCHKNEHKVYSFMLVGMDYEYIYDYSGYRLALWALVKRAKELGCTQANFGISATMEKKRVGARPQQRVGYFQAKDNYALEMMETTIAKERD